MVVSHFTLEWLVLHGITVIPDGLRMIIVEKECVNMSQVIINDSRDSRSELFGKKICLAKDLSRELIQFCGHNFNRFLQRILMLSLLSQEPALVEDVIPVILFRQGKQHHSSS